MNTTFSYGIGTLRSGIVTFNFTVNEEWLDKLTVRAMGPLAPQVYMAAMSDPEQSGIMTDNDGINASIEDVKKLVEKAKAVNAAKDARIRVDMPEPGKYEIRFAGQKYGEDLSLEEAERAISKISAYLDHHNIVKVEILDMEGKSELAKALALEAFIANKAHKFLQTVPMGENLWVIYIPKGWKEMIDGEDET